MSRRPTPTAILLAMLAAAAPPVVASQAAAEPVWIARGATTTLQFHAELLADLGLEIRRVEPREASHADSLSFVAPKPWNLTFRAAGGGFEDFLGGGLRHRGGFELAWRGGAVSLVGFEVRPGSRPQTLEVLDGDGVKLFDVHHIHYEMDLEGRSLELRHMDVSISRELAARLGEPRREGLVIAAMRLTAAVEPPAGVFLPQGACTDPRWPTEPGFDADVALTAISNVQQTAREPGVQVAITPDATLANVGTADVPWYEKFLGNFPPYGNDQHPFLVWALYRIRDGRIEQLGQSEIKHAFFSINSGCSCFGDNILWVGCGDTYSVTTNMSRAWLAPRGEVTAHTGVWARCGSHFDLDCNDIEDFQHAHDSFEHRMAVREADLQTTGSTYFLEAWYVVRDDIDIFNSMGYRQLTPTLVGDVWDFDFVGGFVQGPVVEAWVPSIGPPAGALNTVVRRPDGHLQVAVRTVAVGGGRYRYDYAVMNHDFDRRIDAFSVPLTAGDAPQQIEFRDLDADPGNDWQASVDARSITWRSPGEAAALDWGTLFSFRFELTRAPVATAVRLGIVEPGADEEISVAGLGPTPVEMFSDGFESGNTSAWSQSVP